jgi:hypothetical protein
MMRLAHHLTFYAAIIAVYVLAIMNQAHFILNWDVSWLLHVSQRLLAGGNYTQDFFEINPPLILYLYTPPALLAKLLSISIIVTLRIYVFLLATISLAVSYLLLNKIFQARDNKILILFFLTLCMSLLVLPFQQFGQREHLSIILAMPYLLLVAARLQGNTINKNLAIALGLMAALGFGLKPYFLVTPVLVEVYYLFHTRKLSSMLRPETLTMLFTLLSYLLIVFIFHQSYLHTIIPLALRSYYLPYQTSVWLMLLNQLTFCCYFPVLFFIIQYKNNPYKILSSILLLAMCGYYVAFLMQRTLWDYHVTPAYLMGTLLEILLLGLLAQYSPASKRNIIWLILLALAVGAFLYYGAQVTTLLLGFYPVKFYCYFAVLFAFLLLLRAPKNNWYKLIGATMVIIGVGLLFSFLNQRTSWNEHRFLMTVSVFILMFSVFVPGNYKVKGSSMLIATVTSLLFCYPFYYATGLYQTSLASKENIVNLIPFMQAHAQHKRVYFFASKANLMLPTIDFADAIPAGRTEDAGWVPALLKRSDPLLVQDKNFLITMVTEDLNNMKPEYVFVDMQESKYIPADLHFSFVNFFSENAGFREAWKSYRYLTTVDDPDAYSFEVYERVGSA